MAARAATLLLLIALGGVQESLSVKLVPFKDVPRPPRHLTDEGKSNRIINGQVASLGQFQYQAGIIADGAYLCGGSVIGRKWILTAGHCVEDTSVWVVYLGVVNIEEAQRRGSKAQVYQTLRSYLHPKYSFPNNDIALLLLPESIVFNAFVQKIALASSGSSTSLGQWTTLSGFGNIADDSAVLNMQLWHTSSLRVVSARVCQLVYGERLDGSLLCVKGYHGTSSCEGDSGGPLVVRDSRGVVVQVGVTSFGSVEGCEKDAPVGFTNTTYFLPWLRDTTRLQL